MSSYKYVVLGGGMVAGYCAKEFIEKGGNGADLAIVSADDAVPYERPPLSKSFLAGKDDEDAVFINPAEFYRENGIELKTNTRIASIDRSGKRLLTGSGGELAFETLVYATGAEARPLEIPGASSPNILYLRSLADSKRIRDRAKAAKKVVVVGGGFIAMEVSSVLASAGIETTMIVRDDRIWKSFFTPEMSKFFEKYYSDKGVKLIKMSGISAFEDDSQVRLTNGQTLRCDLLVAGVGVRPLTALANGAGLAVNDGVLVNELLKTPDPNIYAAGDVANYPDTLFENKRRRVEHWDNAVCQGQHIARALLGNDEPFVHVPYFFSDVFDLSYEYWGDAAGADRVVHRGDLHTNSFSVWWLSGDRLVAAFVMNRPDEERENAPELIRTRRPLSATRRLTQATSVQDAFA